MPENTSTAAGADTAAPQFWPPKPGDVWLASTDSATDQTPFACRHAGILTGIPGTMPDDVALRRYRTLQLIWREGRAVIHDEDDEIEAVHHFFGLSYCSFLVLPRVLLQSMPDIWQARFAAVMREYDDACHGIEQAEIYDVIPGRAVEAGFLTEAEQHLTGVSVVEPDEDEDGESGEGGGEVAETRYYDKDGNELNDDSRVIVPIRDPLPPFNRGRTILPEVRDNYARNRVAGDAS